MDGSDPDVYVSSESVKDIPQLYDSPEQNLKLEYKVRETDLNLNKLIIEESVCVRIKRANQSIMCVPVLIKKFLDIV